MRFGETAESLKLLSEERQQGKRPLDGKDDGLAQAQADEIRLLNGDDGSGNNAGFFVLGLHSPFDTNTVRVLAGS